MRGAATEPLLEAFGRCETANDRACVGTALVRASARNDRGRAALVGMLAADPIRAASFLAEYGDARAVPDLVAALDRLELAPAGPGELRRCEEIVALGQAIAALRGRFSTAQRSKVDRAWTRSTDLWLEGGPEIDSPMTP